MKSWPLGVPSVGPTGIPKTNADFRIRRSDLRDFVYHPDLDPTACPSWYSSQGNLGR